MDAQVGKRDLAMEMAGTSSPAFPRCPSHVPPSTASIPTLICIEISGETA